MTLLSGKELAKLVESKGWILLRVNGSHHIYSKPGISVRLPSQYTVRANSRLDYNAI